MSTPVLATKLHIPVLRRQFVSRPRLIERLDAGLSCKLTLVSAPAGFGKTTLLSEWAASAAARGVQLAWLSLDADDNDPARFLQYVLSALEAMQPGLVSSAALSEQSSQPPAPKAILTALVNDLSSHTGSGDRLLVLDDYHVITAPAIHDALEFLLAQLPRSLHLVILSREDPPLPLARLRVRGELVEIREQDLSFTPEEAGAFLSHTMGLTLTPAAVASLTDRTEGWIAALQIAGLSLQNRGDAEVFIASFRGDDRFLLDYLMDEVFGRQTPAIQEFLLHTAVLEQLCAPLCDAMMGIDQAANQTGDTTTTDTRLARASSSNSQRTLEYLERANLFLVPMDSRRAWYRFHGLFADLLRYWLQRTHPERLPQLHRRAFRWYAGSGYADEAMRHALAIPDPTLAADLAERYLLQLIGSSRIATYVSWVQSLPEELVLGRAYLCAGCGWAYVLMNQVDAAERYVRAGEAALAHFEPVMSRPEGRWITQAEVAGNLAAIRSYADRLRNDSLAAVEHAQQALATLPAEAHSVRCAVALNLGMLRLDNGELEPARQAFLAAHEAAKRSRTNAYAGITALSQLGAIAAMQGRLREAEGLFQRAVRFESDELGVPVSGPGSGIIHGWLAWLHYQRNDLPAAQEHLNHVLQSAEQMNLPDTTLRAYLYQALMGQSRGDFAMAEEWFQRAERLMEAHPAPDLIRTEWIAFRGQLYLSRGDTAAASRLLSSQGVQASDLDVRPEPGSGAVRRLGPRLARYLLLAGVLAAEGAFGQAAELAQSVSDLALALPDSTLHLEALILQAAVAGQGRREAPRAIALLERALEMAAPEGYVRPFLNAGEPLMKLLRQAIALGIQPAFARQLHAELARQERQRIGAARPVLARPPEGSGTVSGRLVEPLTAREEQVLRLAAAGLSSTEIARELVISVSTARSYLKNIYGKLDAHSRDEAIEKGKEAGLI